MRVTVSVNIGRRRKVTKKEKLRIKSLMRAVLGGVQTIIDGEPGWGDSSDVREEHGHNSEFEQAPTETARDSEIKDFR